MSDTEDVSPEDRRLLAELWDAVGPDPVPPGLVDACEALVTWADVDVELAELLEAGAAEPVGARGGAPGGPAEQLVFEMGDGTAIVEVDLTGGRVEGRVLPAGHARALLERPGGTPASTTVDAAGRFRFGDPVTGPVRLRFARGGDVGLATGWFLV